MTINEGVDYKESYIRHAKLDTISNIILHHTPITESQIFIKEIK